MIGGRWKRGDMLSQAVLITRKLPFLNFVRWIVVEVLMAGRSAGASQYDVPVRRLSVPRLGFTCLLMVVACEVFFCLSLVFCQKKKMFTVCCSRVGALERLKPSFALRGYGG